MSSPQTLETSQVIDSLENSKWVMLTVAGAEGKLLSHPMSVQQVTKDVDVWFFVGLQGDQADALRANPQVNIAVSRAGAWLSVAGRAEFVEDRAKVDELWDDSVDAWFEQGKDDPNLGLLKVSGESAQFWGLPGGPVSALAQIAKAKITGEQTAGGSRTTEL